MPYVCFNKVLGLAMPLIRRKSTISGITGSISHGGESRDLNDRVHGISCRYSDKTREQTYHTFLNTQPIFIKRSAHTSYLFEASVHLKVIPQYAVVFYTSLNKYYFQYFEFARTSAENYYTL